MSSVLITGAGGFIGTHLVRRLLGRHIVYALDVQTPEEAPSGDVRWIRHDLREPFETAAVPERVDTVVHLAQSPRYRDFPDGAADMFAVNVAGTFALLEYARRAGAKRFLLASTGSVYGFRRRPISESDPARPPDFYAASKYAAETLTGPYASCFATVIFRFFFVYGPGQTGMIVPTLLGRVVRGETVCIEGRPGLRINPIYVDDATAAIEAAAQGEGSGIFNVAGEEAVALTDLVHRMGEAAGVEPHIEHTGDGPPGDLVAETTRMKTALGVVPETPLLRGLRATLEGRAGP